MQGWALGRPEKAGAKGSTPRRRPSAVRTPNPLPDPGIVYGACATTGINSCGMIDQDQDGNSGHLTGDPQACRLQGTCRGSSPARRGNAPWHPSCRYIFQIICLRLKIGFFRWAHGFSGKWVLPPVRRTFWDAPATWRCGPQAGHWPTTTNPAPVQETPPRAASTATQTVPPSDTQAQLCDCHEACDYPCDFHT